MEDLRTKRKGKILAVKDLPTLPPVLDEITKMIEDEHCTPKQIAEVIAKDQVLSAKVLKMVNSPVYGFPRRINTIQHAIVLLGFNVIRGIIISTSVFDVMTQAMVGLWEHSLGCATISKIIAEELGLKDPEEFAVAGLLHDIGKVVIAIQLPEEKEEIQKLVAQEDITYFEAEKKVLGFGHDRVNSWLAEHWNLPLPTKIALTYHHNPSSAEFYQEFAKIVHVADFITKVLEIGNSGDELLNTLSKKDFVDIGLSFKKLAKIMDRVLEDIIEVLTFIPK
ncbi:HDOD domain-containing protein [Desulfothermus sp.]